MADLLTLPEEQTPSAGDDQDMLVTIDGLGTAVGAQEAAHQP